MNRVRKKRFVILVSLFVLLILVLLYTRPVPKTSGQPNLASPNVLQGVNLPWPAAGHASVGAVGYGLLDSTGTQTAVPMASVAKVMTALAVLGKKPLSLGQQGPTITISSDDAATYQSYYSQGQSVVPVTSGEQISEFKALQAMLIPSANNMAYTLANWAFGSTDAYLVFANQEAQILGLKNSHFADASGFDPKTTSTADDLILLGQAAMKNPVFASIVSQNQTDFPVVGTIKNVNFLLGTEGITGIKTGNTDQAGGVYLLSAQRTVQGQVVTTLVAVMGSSSLFNAMNDARNILKASDIGFSQNQIAKAGQDVGLYKTAWGTTLGAGPAQDFSALTWVSKPAKITISLNDLAAGTAKGTKVGTILVTNAEYSKSAPLYLDRKLAGPGIWWRIFH